MFSELFGHLHQNIIPSVTVVVTIRRRVVLFSNLQGLRSIATTFGTQRSQVQILSPRLDLNPAESRLSDTCRRSAVRPVVQGAKRYLPF